MHIHFREEYDTGNSLIDAQHHDLIELLNKAIASIQQNLPLKDVYLDLLDLQMFLDYHFRCEKMEMGLNDAQSAHQHTTHCHNLLERLDQSIRSYGFKHIEREQLIREMILCLQEHLSNDTTFIRTQLNKMQNQHVEWF